MASFHKYEWILFFVTQIGYGQIDTLSTVEINSKKNITPSKTYKIEKFDSKIIEENATNSLSELLNNSSSLYLKNYGMGSLSTPSIRGAGAEKTKLYWNGIEINSSTLGSADLAIIPISFLDEVELHYGSASIIDGSGGLGGAIHMNSHADYTSTNKISITKEFGSFSNNKTYLTAKVGKKNIESRTSLFQVSAINDYSYRDISQKDKPILKRENAELSKKGFKQEFYFKPKVNHEIAIKTNYFDSKRNIPSVIGVSTNGEIQTDKNTRILGEWNFLKGKFFNHLRMAYLKDDLLYLDTVANIYSPILTESFRGNYHLKYAINDSIFIKTLLTASNDVAISSGFTETKSQQKEAIYAHFEHQTKFRLLYNIALRQEVIDQKITPLIPTIGFKYAVDKKQKWNVNANASKNYKFPTLNEKYWYPGGNVNLQPEIGYSAEGGINFISKVILINATAYLSLIDNWIQWLPTDKGYWSPINVKKVKNNGLEITAATDFSTGKNYHFSIQGGYSYTNSINLENHQLQNNSIGKQLIYVPKNSFNINVHAYINRLVFGYLQTITGKVYIDSDNTTYMPYYAPANISFLYQLKGDGNNSGTIGLKINNLFNEEYQILANRPMPGRWFSLSLKFNLASSDE